MAIIKIEEGGIWEHKQFEIQTDLNISEHENTCRHVKDGHLKAVIVAENEGGYNTTGVCVECIIEALKTNNLI